MCMWKFGQFNSNWMHELPIRYTFFLSNSRSFNLNLFRLGISGEKEGWLDVWGGVGVTVVGWVILLIYLFSIQSREQNAETVCMRERERERERERISSKPL